MKMGKLLSKQKVVLFDIDRTLFDTEVFKQSNLQRHTLYKEVFVVLEELAKIAELGIFSEGKEDLQLAKLVKTAIHKHFAKERIHIVASKADMLEEVLNAYKNMQLYFVDDKLPILYEAKNILPTLFTVWVKRGKYAMVQKPISGFTPDAVVFNLKSIPHIVAEN